MSYWDKGLRSLFTLKKMQHEIDAEKRARNAVAKRLGVSTLAKPIVPAPVDQRMNDLINLSSVPPINLTTPEEKKDEFGYTAKQNKQILNYLTRPKEKKENAIPRYKSKLDRLIEKPPKHLEQWGSKEVKKKQDPNAILKWIDKVKMENGDPPFDNVKYDATTGSFTDGNKRGALTDFIKPDYEKHAEKLKAVKDFHQPKGEFETMFDKKFNGLAKDKIEAKKTKPYKYTAGGWDNKRLT
jgi:hypothetical protein